MPTRTVILILLAAIAGYGASRCDGLNLAIADSFYCGERMEEALQAYRIENTVESRRGEVRCLLALDRVREAYPKVMALLREGPEDRTARLLFAEALGELHALPESEAAFQALTSEDPRDAEAWYFFARLRYQNGDYPAALQGFDHLLQEGLVKELDPPADRVRARVYRVLASAQAGKGMEVEPAFAALANNPIAVADPDFLLTYARLLLESGRAEQALHQINRAVAQGPTTMAYFWRARAQMHLHRNHEALDDAEQAVALAPQLPFARTLLVRLYQQAGRQTDAQEQAEWLRHYEARADHVAAP